jgi:hypothetical protein
VMLVEADSVDKAIDDEGNEQSVYKGQSGGAYEKFWKETPGAVVAIMNPTFLPYNPVRLVFPFFPFPPSLTLRQRRNSRPIPSSQLRLTRWSSSDEQTTSSSAMLRTRTASLAEVGSTSAFPLFFHLPFERVLISRSCSRTGKFCEYHINRALQRTAGSRPETYAK